MLVETPSLLVLGATKFVICAASGSPPHTLCMLPVSLSLLYGFMPCGYIGLTVVRWNVPVSSRRSRRRFSLHDHMGFSWQVHGLTMYSLSWSEWQPSQTRICPFSRIAGTIYHLEIDPARLLSVNHTSFTHMHLLGWPGYLLSLDWVPYSYTFRTACYHCVAPGIYRWACVPIARSKLFR